MTTTAAKTNLLGMSQDMLERYFAERDEKPFRARQLMQWVYQRGIVDFDDMTDLSKKLRDRLKADAAFELPQVQSRHDSVDGTVKWLFATDCGQAIETVFIPEPGRGTLCISSQVGCALDCAFCATGAQGFNRNLTSAEIIGQVLVANSELPRRDNGEPAVTNVVFMGMGEPLANYRNVIPVLRLLVSDRAYGLSWRRVTVSTSGIVPHIDKLGEDCNVALAVSLHATNDALRDRLVPINRLHPIDELLEACWRYAAGQANRFITFEYVMLRGVNDSFAHADELCELLANRPAKVNLIPFNPFTGTEFRRSAADTIRHFQERLRQRGLVATIRRTRGDDIDAACGQLAGEVSNRVRNRLGEKRRRAANKDDRSTKVVSA
ncbi:MAG: 23S rRNA (adenine(2503)-C(2))-methyltransferase RlmN [Gammaproteobacteria bacterium]|nr:23S rRNA (adenine(2503)-C(2))-methyltransferase RlmN [Gammaproteobacteria bacterium]NNF50736.1 23S rRNA (adenine(2503)-C(2))-methyltransferase RlmN [Woeseiaceae bacterium]MBT8094947.1 23S rRNA (adenine(2503)-C(2))-methyltransferase RlmN [Gammaproteobacteria bacterium]MBT8105452.1 23S rRNA (adenine(2503)-C(2))-methyltransferase RlmN [Gammaproteobacteria bacterium]NNK25466.1 23S rRNA (adenine(2503)-C(2))-methyltransferase RlmN [Woeseiaceae bacterium]